MAGTTTRRRFLQAGALTAGAVLLPKTALSVPFAGEVGVARAVPMAMHVHASFSEGPASMEAQLAQAAANGVEVLWWTEHDWRMSGYGYRRAVHFDGLTEAEDGLPWTWVPARFGTLSEATGGIVTAPASPVDPSTPGALQVGAVASGSAFASHRYRADTTKARANIRASLGGQRLRLEVYPQAVGADAFAEVLVVTSYRPPRGRATGGRYTLSYRLGGPGAAGSRVRSGLTGVVTLAAPADAWTSVVLDPAADLTAIWPDVDGRDASLGDLYLGAASRNGAEASACFDYLRFERASAGSAPLVVQAELMAHYAPRFPTVTQQRGLEISLYRDHVNGFGGRLALPDYTPAPVLPAADDDGATAALVDRVHAGGGLASYNHPFGSPATQVGTAGRAQLVRAVAADLLDTRAHGTDILEVGYRARGGAGLAEHLAVWDVCSRNGLFLTGNGVNDNHGGPWRGEANNFVTWAWAADTSEETLLGALRAGRVFTGDVARFRGTLDLRTESGRSMGGVDFSTQASRRLWIAATGVPGGGSVVLVQGAVDYSGVPEQQVSTTAFPALDFDAGGRSVAVHTPVSSFVRTEVRDAAGVTVAVSNPVWFLREEPVGGVPAARMG